jgi:type IV pilus assembly protein PilY1
MKTLQARLMKTLLPTMLAALAFAPLADSARAALTPIADAPLISISVVKPNIMFTLDNSGSMAWQSITGADALGQYSNAARGFYSKDYNGIYYDPNVTYLPGVTADGTSMGNSPPAAAVNDPYLAPAGAKTDVTGLCYTENATPTQTLPVSTNCSATLTATYKFGPYAKYAYYYVWNGAGSKTVDASYPTRVDIMSSVATYSRESAKRTDCAAAQVASPPAMINCTYAEEIQNFANWYSYYRSRILMTKTSVGRAFTIVDPIANPVNTPKVRVGFNTITDAGGTKNSDVADGKYWLTIRDFDTAQKTAWYSKLYAINPANGTPLRTAMQKIGELYRGKLAGAADPVQYSCQPNNHILATDGYWNDATEPVLPAIDTNYAGINGGNLDGFAANPNATRADGAIDVNGAKNSLADVAMLYYSKDLRDGSMNNCTGALGLDVCKNDVPEFADLDPPDTAKFQHMRTYTIGLGANGTKPYQSDYRTATSGFFYELTQNLNQPASNWPLPVKDDPTAIDDLWHAAVNGHGIYLNAKNSSALEAGLEEILRSAMKGGVSAGVALGGAVLSPGENDKAYGVSFSGDWTGDVKPNNIDPGSAAVTASSEWGTISPGVFKGAQAKLDELGAGTGWKTARHIVTMKGGAGVPFSWTDISPAQQTALVSEDVLNYLRGNKDKEGVAAGKFRVRKHLLGDIVDSGVVVVAKPKARFVDSYNPGYNSFKIDPKQDGRAKMLYVGANDGMLHAFDAATGVEKWAYIPSMLIKSGSDGLAALSYQDLGVPQFSHHFYVNQPPTVEDVDFANTGGAGGSGDWRTILVGGLNKGGKGFYALDVTDPAAMGSEAGVAGKVLWEFTDSGSADMGYSFGKPLIVKTRAYGWVVIVTSGYNNASGKGVLYVLNAKTGALLKKFNTNAPGEGAGNPSGLARITGYTLDYGDYTTEQVYGGDLFGNMWRFDVSNPSGGGWPSDATLFAKTESGQPITTAPQIEVDLKSRVDRWVFFGTGKYLDPTDNGTTTTQTMYAIKDGSKATPTSTGLPFSKSSLVAITGVGTGAAIPAGKQGWYYDLSAGERVTIDPVANEQIIGWITALPTNNACSPGGASGRVYAREYSTGLSRVDDGVGSSPTTIAYKDSTSQYVKIQFVKTADGKIKVIATDADGKVTIIEGKWGPTSGIAVRSNSREILN